MLYGLFIAFVIAVCVLLAAASFIDWIVGAVGGFDGGRTTYYAYGREVSAREFADLERQHQSRTDGGAS